VIRFTNALLFYFKVSTLDLFTPVRPSLAWLCRRRVRAA
jgi:hypothetical protein